MGCITFQGKVVQVSLLTHSDKIKKIEEVFSGNRHKSDIFLPDDDFYESTVSAEDPERMADSIFKWLGIKHRSVHFHVDPNQEQLLVYTHKKNASQLSLGPEVLQDPLLCAAVVAHGIVHHLLIARAKISLGESDENEALADLGTIYAGLGILVINGFETKQSALGSMGTQNYASEFLDYCSELRIVKSLWQPYVLPSVASEYLSTSTPLQKLKPFIKSRLSRSASRRKKITFGLTVMLVTMGGVFYIMASQPKYLSAEMQEKRGTIALLKNQVEQCQNTVAYKQQKWDQSDIFIQRQIDADKTRCTSLTNRYNYEVNDYNSKL